MSSLTTCDPGDIYTTLSECKKTKIRCSIIGLSAEVFICKKIAQELEGTYAVILDELHFNDLLNKNAFPLPNKVRIFENWERIDYEIYFKIFSIQGYRGTDFDENGFSAA